MRAEDLVEIENYVFRKVFFYTNEIQSSEYGSSEYGSICTKEWSRIIDT